MKGLRLKVKLSGIEIEGLLYSGADGSIISQESTKKTNQWDQYNSSRKALDHRKKTADLNQPMHYKDALPSAWRQGKVSRWGRGYAYFPREIISNRLLLILSKLIKIKHEQETSCRPLQLSLQKMRHRRPLDQTTNHTPPSPGQLKTLCDKVEVILRTTQRPLMLQMDFLLCFLW